MEMRVEKIEAALQGFESKFSSMEDALNEVTKVVSGLRDDVKELQHIRQKEEMDSEIDKRAQELAAKKVSQVLISHGIVTSEIGPAELHPAPELPVGKPAVSISRADKRTAGQKLAQYVIDTPRYYLALFILLIVIIFSGGPSVASRVLEVIIGRVSDEAPDSPPQPSETRASESPRLESTPHLIDE